jgi:hypothetical protein
MLKMTSREKESRLRRLKFRVQALTAGISTLAFLAACEGTLGPGAPGDSVGDGDAMTGDGDMPPVGDGDTPGDGDGDGDLPDPPKEDPTVPGGLLFDPPAFDLDGEPYYSRAVLLTNDQWANSVQTILNLPEKPGQANSFLDPVRNITTFDNNEIVLEVNNDMRAAYQLAAAEVAESVASSTAISAVNAGTEPESFVRNFGRRAFRRPLSEDEVAGYTALFEIGAGLTSGGDTEFARGANLVIEGMLQSPNFLYRTELAPDATPLSGFEIAAKLSYWFLGVPPTDALLDRAAAGEFDSAAGVSALAEEFLADPRTTDMMVNLYAQLLEFHRFENVLKEDPQYNPAINAELDEASRLFIRHLFENDLGLDDLLTTTQGFVGPLLAEYYGISPAPSEPTLQELGPERVGFFSQVPYLMTHGDGAHSDAIHRGVYINFDMLCAKLRLPDGVVVPPLPAPDPTKTDRMRIDDFTGNGTCGQNCHGGYINPLGFAFENFDGLGRPRATDAGNPVDTTAYYPFIDGEMVEFTGAPELMPLIAESEVAHKCLAKNFLSYALSRDIVATDDAAMEQLKAVSMSEGGSFKAILRELVKSPAFLSRPGAI